MSTFLQLCTPSNRFSNNLFYKSEWPGLHETGGNDRAAKFSGCHNGVQKRITAHVLYIHCTSHKLQLASIQAAESGTTIKKIFGTMTNLWKMFHNSKKSRSSHRLKGVQSVLSLLELKVVKPSDTRWLYHKQCVQSVQKELPTLIITLQQLFEESSMRRQMALF